LAADGHGRVDLLASDPGGLVGDVAGVLLGVDLAGEVDDDTDEDDHHDCSGGQPHRDRASLGVGQALAQGGHHRSR
jgi:hypothetical protein